MNRFTRIAAATTFLLASGAASAGLPINIPLLNPGAETGDTAGWPDKFGFEASGDAAAAYAGNNFFRVDTAALPSVESLVGNPPYLYMRSDKIDLSAYAGRIDNIEMTVQARIADLSLVVESGLHGFSRYQASGLAGITLFDAEENYLAGLGYVTQNPDWQEAGGTFDWYSRWNDIRGDIASVRVDLAFEFFPEDYDNQPSLDELLQNPNDILDFYYSWTGEDGNSYDDISLEFYSGQELPLSGYDEARLSISTVPLPAAFWLFGSALSALLGWTRLRRR